MPLDEVAQYSEGLQRDRSSRDSNAAEGRLLSAYGLRLLTREAEQYINAAIHPLPKCNLCHAEQRKRRYRTGSDSHDASVAKRHNSGHRGSDDGADRNRLFEAGNQCWMGRATFL